MYKSAASFSFEDATKTITNVEESSLKFEIKKFYNWNATTLTSTLTSTNNVESNKVELLSIDAVWWVTMKIPNSSKQCSLTVNLEAKPGSSYVSKNFEFYVEAKIDDIQFFGPSTLQTCASEKWKFNNVTSIIASIYGGAPSCAYDKPAMKLAAVVASKGSLVLDFKLSVVHTSNGAQTCKFDHPTSTFMKNEIVANHSKMLDDPTFSDFTFIVQGKSSECCDKRSFKVHKNVLAAASEVFVKLFTTKMEESSKNECKVTHLDPFAFGLMLRFIYSGNLPRPFTAEVAQNLFEIAQYYDIKTLKKVCEPEILNGLNVKNALELYNFSQIYELDELKKKAWVIVKRDLLKVFFPLKNEPLPSADVEKILEHQAEDKEFWMPFKLEEVTNTSNRQAFGLFVSKKAESLIVELEDSSNGSKIINQIREMDGFNESDWTDEQPSISTHFRNQDLERSDSTSESYRTLIESPTKSVVHGIEGWDEVKDSVVNSTVFNVSSTEWGEENDQERAGDWTPGSLFECRPSQNTYAGVTENEDDITMTASSKSSEPGSSSKPSRQPSPSSASGVSSGELDKRPKGEPVVITAVTSPSDFTLRRLSDDEAYKNHQEEIQRLALAQPPLTIFTKDTYCVALRPFEDVWCRSIILYADPVNFTITVKSLDDGSTFTIGEKSQLKTMSIAMLFSPYYAIRCSLPICYPFSKDEQVVKYLMRIRDGNLGYEEITRHKDRVFVELFDHHGRNVVETLVEMGLGKRQFVAPNALALICSLQDSSKFVVQMMSSQEELTQIKEYVELYQQHDVGTPKEGMLVMALFQRDNLWRRARIQRISNSTFYVYFIDYGSTEAVQTIGIIDDPAVACILPIAIRCSLYLPPEIGGLNRRAEQRFVKIIKECKECVHIKMKMPGDDFAVIEIFIEGKDILTLIQCPDEDRKNSHDMS